jgi:hypothetical protein
MDRTLVVFYEHNALQEEIEYYVPLPIAQRIYERNGHMRDLVGCFITHFPNVAISPRAEAIVRQSVTRRNLAKRMILEDGCKKSRVRNTCGKTLSRKSK